MKYLTCVKKQQPSSTHSFKDKKMRDLPKTSRAQVFNMQATLAKPFLF